ncbi:sensor histidine kinase [Oceanidesulfovibrio marinus]|uniref:histidine kinase n=1 Tax=Oceanidesulfovibrio marinus TaxID=370038 RepID=A0A6P1ZI18_9BACT|nr:sensor histidine kinase [Oceanidesulfovibrio marinus]TVM34982.1 hypothetical protein DQK91_06115 [Oceanidesulfovibrio marinus]
MLTDHFRKYRLLCLALLGGVVVYFLDAVMDWLVFYPGSFSDLLYANVPPHEWYIRLVLLFLFVGFGIYAQRQVSIRERLNADLQQTVADKEALLREVHHRIKNNLSVVLALVEMQRENVQDSRTLETLDQVRTRLDAIILIHKQIYSQDHFASMRLDTYLQKLGTRLLDLYNHNGRHIELVHEMEPVEVSPKEAVPCGLICSELLTNACKHAFDAGESGTVTLRLAAVPSGFAMSVCDNGRGFPESFSLDDSTGLGLQLVRSLARQLNGTLRLHNTAGSCITVHVS